MHNHLKWLCSRIGIWADAHFLGRSRRLDLHEIVIIVVTQSHWLWLSQPKIYKELKHFSPKKCFSIAKLAALLRKVRHQNLKTRFVQQITLACQTLQCCVRIRQWPEVSDFVARFCTLRESKNLRLCENRVRATCKNVTQIIYLGPLPSWNYAPRAQPLILHSKTLGVMARWHAGAQTWTQTWSLQRDQRQTSSVLCPVKQCADTMEFEFFWGLFRKPKLRLVFNCMVVYVFLW